MGDVVNINSVGIAYHQNEVLYIISFGEAVYHRAKLYAPAVMIWRLRLMMCRRFAPDKKISFRRTRFFGADDEARTRYLHLGKVALYQMSYIRTYREQEVLYTFTYLLSIVNA